VILADENIDTHIVSILRSNGIEVLHIKDGHLGISDSEVIRLSKSPKRIILTEDKDFGEWVYSHKEKEIGVIFLRFEPNESKSIILILLELLKSKGDQLFGKFTTITTRKIRIRSLK